MSVSGQKRTRMKVASSETTTQNHNATYPEIRRCSLAPAGPLLTCPLRRPHRRRWPRRPPIACGTVSLGPAVRRISSVCCRTPVGVGASVRRRAVRCATRNAVPAKARRGQKENSKISGMARSFQTEFSSQRMNTQRNTKHYISSDATPFFEAPPSPSRFAVCALYVAVAGERNDCGACSRRRRVWAALAPREQHHIQQSHNGIVFDLMRPTKMRDALELRLVCTIVACCTQEFCVGASLQAAFRGTFAEVPSSCQTAHNCASTLQRSRQNYDDEYNVSTRRSIHN